MEEADTCGTTVPSTQASPPPSSHRRPRGAGGSDEVNVVINVNNPSGQEEARLVAKVADKKSSVAFVISHPYGPLGGNMLNNVVTALALFLQLQGFSTLRFNFRGVSGSTGRPSWRGGGEVNDMKAACRYMLSLPEPPSQLVIIGYSYGSVIGYSAAGEMPEVSAFVGISYPFSVAWALTLWNSGQFLTQGGKINRPKLFITGDHDNFSPISTFEQRVKQLPSPLDVVTVEGMDHFWFRRESVLCDVVAKWLSKIFGTRDLQSLVAMPKEQVKVLETVEDTRQRL